MDKISLCTVTRKRPLIYRRLVVSALDTATYPDNIELVTYRDDDDETRYDTFKNSIEIVGPRILYAEMWNECARKATGEILMQVPDDFVFETNGWDEMVYQAFNTFPDKILMVFPYDGIEHHKGFGTTFFLHRNWIDTIGYFVPPYFVGYYIDNWVNGVADSLGRRYEINATVRHVWVEHDDTHQEYIARTKQMNSRKLYAQLRPKRVEDINKLKTFIADYEKRSDLCKPS